MLQTCLTRAPMDIHVFMILLLTCSNFHQGTSNPVNRNPDKSLNFNKEKSKGGVYLSESSESLSESSGDMASEDSYLPVVIEDNIFTNYASDDWKAYKYEKTEESHATFDYCSAPLGIARDAVHVQTGFTLSANDGEAVLGHLNGHASWSSRNLPMKTYIQVEFSKRMLVTGILTQGSPSSVSRVTHFMVAHSDDCQVFTPLTISDGNITEFAANLESNTTSTTMFDRVFQAKCLRILPTQRVGDETSLRFELLGCNVKNCDRPIVASEVVEGSHWKRIVFDSEKIISYMKIVGFPSSSIPVLAYVVYYSRTCDFRSNGRLFTHPDGTPKVFVPEPDSDEVIVTDVSEVPIRAQCLVISPIGGYDVTGDEDPDPIEFMVIVHGCDAMQPHESNSTCGKSRTPPPAHARKKRVVGGVPTAPGEWPWLVSLHFNQEHYYTTQSGLKHICGGSLIARQWVLTTAHCFSERMGVGLSNRSNWNVVLGEHNQATEDGTEQGFEVEQIFIHPNFVLDDDSEILWDIALVKLEEPARLSDYVNVICIEPNVTFPVGTACVTAGWGNMDYDGYGVELPNHVLVDIMDQTECRDRYQSLPDGHDAKAAVAIVDSVLCAMAETNGRDSCSGDSGGPLACYHDNHWTQVGIVSIGYECGDVRYPAVYTRVSYYYDWIMHITSTM